MNRNIWFSEKSEREALCVQPDAVHTTSRVYRAANVKLVGWTEELETPGRRGVKRPLRP